MITVDLNDTTGYPSFCALSYTWENPRPRTQPEWYDEHEFRLIVVNGTWFRVRPNLFFALQQISRKFRNYALFIWVDAICINQNDNEEKSKQVRRMKDIFSRASETLVWLGPADGATNVAFAKLNAMSRDYDKQNKAAAERNENPYHGYSMPYMLILGRELNKEELVAPSSIGREQLEQTWGLSQTMQLMSRRWWERAWIWQEIARSGPAMIMCGPYEADMAEFWKATDAISRDQSTSGKFGDPIEPIFLNSISDLFAPAFDMSIMRLRLAADLNDTDFPALDLGEVLQAIRHTEASDPRDKVFAALGLCDMAHGVRVDYESSTAQVYMDVVERHIAINKNTGIFGYCQYPPMITNLPTWSPDWTDRTVRRSPLDRRVRFLFSEKSLYFAGGASYASPIVEMDMKDLKAFVLAAVFRELVFTAIDPPPKPHRLNDNLMSTVTGQNVWHAACGVQYCWLRQWARLKPHGGQRRFLATSVCVKCSRRGRLKRRMIFRLKRLCVFEKRKSSKQFLKLLYRFTGESVLHAYIRTIWADVIMSPSEGSKARIGELNHIPNDSISDGVVRGRTFATTEFDDFALVPIEA